MKSIDLSGAISAAAVVAAIPAVADATAVIGFFSAIISAGLTLVALIFRVADIIRRVKVGKLTAEKAAEESAAAAEQSQTVENRLQEE